MLLDIFAGELPILTIEEAILSGGFGSAILEFAETHNYGTKYIKRMGIKDEFIEHGSVELILEQIGLTKQVVIREVQKLLPTKQQRV